MDRRPEQQTQEELSAGLGARLRRRRALPPRKLLAASVLLHLLAGALLWAAGVTLRPELPQFRTYAVTIVSPPAQVLAPEQEPVQTTTPVAIEPPRPAEPTPTPPQPREQPRTQAPRPTPVTKPDPTPARGPDPKPVSIGGENIDIRIEGEAFPFPEYLEGITLALMQYFRWNGPNLEAEVVFNIQRDGSVGPGQRLSRRSGNFDFDMRTMEAVEQAGKNRAFGPLPKELQGDRLWISFTFKPRR